MCLKHNLHDIHQKQSKRICKHVDLAGLGEQASDSEAAHHYSHGRGVVPEALEELHQVLRHQGVPRDQVGELLLLLLVRQLALQKQVCALNEVAGTTGRWIRQFLNRVPSRAKVSMVVRVGLDCEMLIDTFSNESVKTILYFIVWGVYPL